MPLTEIRLESEYDYCAYDASMAINYLSDSGRVIVKMSYSVSYDKWKDVLNGQESGTCEVAYCCWLTSPLDPSNCRKENLMGIQASFPADSYRI